MGDDGASQVSERTRQRIDDEVKRVVEEAHDEAIRLLTENRSRLDGIAEALLREETLDQPQAYAAAGLAPRPRTRPHPSTRRCPSQRNAGVATCTGVPERARLARAG